MTHTSLQATIRHPVTCRSLGLHNGKECSAELLPAPANSGILLQNLDHPTDKPFKLTVDCVKDGVLATTIADPKNMDAQISTIEHLLAALHAFSIDNILIKVKGSEIPIMDGTAQPFISLLEHAGKEVFKDPQRKIRVLETVKVEDKNGGWAELSPSNDLNIELTIDFPDCLIKKQSLKMKLDKQHFIDKLGDARTFVEKKHIEPLREQGLTLGGSLDNAVVIDGNKVVNEGGFRTPDECVRHKMMDIVGDLYCAGLPIIGSFVGYKTGHRLNHELLRTLLNNKNSWEYA